MVESESLGDPGLMAGAAPVFIESGPTVYTGDDAIERLEVTNDREFVVSGLGIPAVDEKRWNLAQRAEHSHWFDPEGHGRRADDRNFDHYRRFAGYEVLRAMVFPHALEIGCGPFTNLRLIAGICRIESCSLLDPSLNEYLGHRSAYYNRTNLFIPPLHPLAARFWSRGPAVGRQALRWTGRTLPVHSLLSIGAEDAPAEFADLVVMINVLEHCRDARTIIQSLKAAVRLGGVLVFADKCYSAEVVEQRAHLVYDQAHPLRVSEEVLRPLFDGFDILYESSILDAATEPYLPGTRERYWIMRKRV